MKEDTEKFVLRMAPALKDTLTLSAKAQHRSLNSEINVRLHETLKDEQASMLSVAMAPILADGQLRFASEQRVEDWVQQFARLMHQMTGHELRGVAREVEEAGVSYSTTCRDLLHRTVYLRFSEYRDGYHLDTVQINL